MKSRTLCLLLLLTAALPLYGREIVDMNHQRVVVPDRITRIYAMNVTVEYMVYAVDPALLVARTARASVTQDPYFLPAYQKLPVLGGAFGNGLSLNREMLLTVKPDVILVRGDDAAYGKKELDEVARLGIPIVAVDVSSISRYADSFDFLGKLLGREKRGGQLSAYTRKTLLELRNTVGQIPAQKRVKVYSSRMQGGLDTVCENSSHAELIPLAGGRNPIPCTTKEFTGMLKLDMEQVMAINPQVVVTMSTAFAASVSTNPRWQDIAAVKSHRVYLAPKRPLNWLDGPPSLMGILGVQWLAHALYPALYPKDVTKETQQFVQLFFGVRLGADDVAKILTNAYNDGDSGH